MAMGKRIAQYCTYCPRPKLTIETFIFLQGKIVTVTSAMALNTIGLGET